MIAHSHRFHGYGTLRYVYSRGKAVRGGSMALRYSENPKQKQYRMAVVVSKKVHKSAVVRNRIRRRVYEAVRLKQHAITKPYDIIITVFSAEVATMAADKLQKTVYGLLTQAHIMGKES